MSLVHRSGRILREDGVLSLLWRSVRFVWTTTVWRQELVQRLPVWALEFAFDVRSRLLFSMSDANPARPIMIDPDEIEYYHGSDDPWRLGRVLDGDWDEPEGRFEETAVYRSLEARFLEGVDWAETELYTEYRDRLEAGDPYWRCTTEAELEAYFERIDDLYESMAEEGYRSQRELLADDDADPRGENTDAVHPVVQEIGVNVYRDGELVKKGAGFHRLAIAKLLDLEEIPVTVRVRHADWQAVRDEIRAASSPEELGDRARAHLEHPDLQDVVPEHWRASTIEPTDRPDRPDREAPRTDDSEDDDVPVPRR